jgi:HPt (histidine-containing phosphotransfer) domain-containing protein
MTAPTTDHSSPDSGLDAARLADFRGLLGNMLDDILRAWLADTPDTLAAARAALDSGRLADAVKAMHAVKGSSSNVGATRLSSLAHTLEAQLAQATAEIDAPAAMAQLEIEFEHAARGIRELIRR